MNLPRLYHTVKYLKSIQLWYQVKYRMDKPKSLEAYLSSQNPQAVNSLSFFPLPIRPSVLKFGDHQFEFTLLNKKKSYARSIHWADESFGKLWNYNLQYLDFLREESIPTSHKQKLLRDLYQWLEKGKLPLEPYPVSLRILNVIRFLHMAPEVADQFHLYLHAEASFLSQRLEYHLLANHLLENGFALLMAGHYFEQANWKMISEKVLLKELDEQIMADGAHYERSPMYHQIMLFRVLEALAYVPDSSLRKKLENVATKMLGWIDRITFKNEDIPHFNDSTDGIAFSTEDLKEMAGTVRCQLPIPIALKDSGFRKLENKRLELVANVHGISPSYQPGHAHADHLSFVLYVDQKPFIVDQGVSTYDIGERRSHERSTKAHNTVTIEDRNTSQVWSGFRVGKRAKVKITEDSSRRLSAHLHFEKFFHERTFVIEENSLTIQDQVKPEEKMSVLRYHFHPSVQWEIDGDRVNFNGELEMEFIGNSRLEKFVYLYNRGYNLQVPSKGLKVLFKKECSTIIKLGK